MFILFFIYIFYFYYVLLPKLLNNLKGLLKPNISTNIDLNSIDINSIKKQLFNNK